MLMGTANKASRLSTLEVAAIRRSADRSSILAERHGISRRAVWLVRTGRSYPWVYVGDAGQPIAGYAS